MKKVGIFGGTFNPVHQGHVSLCAQIKRAKNLDEIWIIPTGTPPHKSSDGIIDDVHRLAMCAIAFPSHEGYHVLDIECNQKGKNYTADTLAALQKQHPDCSFYFIMGSDMFLTFTQWYDYRNILQMAHLLVGARSKDDAQAMQEMKYTLQNDEKIEIIPVDVVDISSTQARTRIAFGFDAAFWLNAEVWQCIKEHKLYLPNKESVESIKLLLRDCLSDGRYYHTECVVKLAKELAKRFCVSEQKAVWAALLHDIMKDCSQDDLLQYITKNGIMLSGVEKEAPALWHAITGSFFAESLGFDEEIVSAIRYHTTARAQMSDLEKIIYVADGISEDRAYPNIDKVRALLDQGLDFVILNGVKMTLQKLIQKQKPLHPDTLQAYHTLIKKIKKDV